jgi:uncharacterized protein YecE (DUF72 family)
VYVYFDNDVKVHAPFDALALAKATGRERSVSSSARRGRYSNFQSHGSREP